MILPNDILLRTTSEGVTLWVSQRLVVERCGVSEDILRTTARKRYKQSLPASWQKVAGNAEFWLGDTGKSWRWGRRGGQYYYDYARIPDRAPSCYRSLLPTREELEAFVEDNNLSQSRERRAALRGSLTAAVAELEDSSDVRWIQTQSGFQIELAMCRDYGRALAWCRLVKSVIRDGRVVDYGVATNGDFYDSCAAIIADLHLSNFRVTTGASLRKKLAGFPADVEEQRRWIISGKIGNNNRQIVGKYPLVDTETGEIYKFDIHQAVMFAAYMNIDGPEKEHLQDLYNEAYVPAMNEFNLIPAAYRTFCNHLSRLSTRLLLDAERHGWEYYRKHYLTYTPSEKLTWAHSLFCGDGSGLFGYRYTLRSRRGNGSYFSEVRVMNLYAILISDVHSGYIAGYGIAPEGEHKETFEMLQAAVRMAVRNGGNQTMFEFVSDNHPAFSSEQSRDFLHKAFNRVRRIAPGNSQANPAETQFRLFKNSTLRHYRNFIRSSHNAAIDNRANIENLDKYDYPTYDEAVRQLEEAVTAWNNKKRGNGKTPAEMFAEKNPACQPLDAVALRQINGQQAQTNVERLRGIINPSGRRGGMSYEIPNYTGEGVAAISRATGNGYDSSVRVVYDETGADLYSMDGRYILTCAPAVHSSMAHIEATADTMEARKHHRERKEAQMEAVWQCRDEVERMTDYLAGNGYTEAVQLGARKEDINGEYEAFVNVSIADKKAAARKLRALEVNDERREAAEQLREAASIEQRYLERQMRKFQEREKQQSLR